jgi:hypothetical protein
MKMKTTEIFELNKELNNIFVHPDILNEHSYGKEWSDIAFPNLKTVAYVTTEMWTGDAKPDRVEKYRHELEKPFCGKNFHEGEHFIFEETPEKDLTWKELMTLVDNLVGRSGDKSHEHFEGFVVFSDGCVNNILVLTGS